MKNTIRINYLIKYLYNYNLGNKLRYRKNDNVTTITVIELVTYCKRVYDNNHVITSV